MIGRDVLAELEQWKEDQYLKGSMAGVVAVIALAAGFYLGMCGGPR